MNSLFCSKSRTFSFFTGLVLVFHIIGYYFFFLGSEGIGVFLIEFPLLIFLLMGVTSKALVDSFNSRPDWLSNFIAGIHATSLAAFGFIAIIFLFVVTGFASGNLIFLSIFILLLGFASDRSNNALNKLSESSNIEEMLSNPYEKLIIGLIVITILLYFVAAFFVGR